MRSMGSMVFFLVLTAVFSRFVWLNTELTPLEKSLLTLFLAVVLALTQTVLMEIQNSSFFVSKGR